MAISRNRFGPSNSEQETTDRGFFSGLLKAEDAIEIGASCDHFAHVCDINCCFDPDCSEEERLAFDCHDDKFEQEPSNEDASLMCFNDGLFEGTSVCPVRVNSPYLGLHYREVKGPDILQNGHFNWKIPDSQSVLQDNRFGSEVMINGLPLMVEGSWGPVEGYCPPDGTPLLYLIERTSYCFARTHPCPPSFREMASLGSVWTVTTRTSVDEVPPSYLYLEKKNRYREEDGGECKDVVLSMNYSFIWKGSYLLGREVNVLTVKALHGSSRLYIKQRFDIKFRHVSANETVLNTNSTRLILGYDIGDSLIFS
ncbi:hypothetical protein AAG570_000857 [Ranatra chinensis]|uniref:Tectonic domain-containing protein n=1 Tax=Ranatra chinensis TaxID=642074 RepID=A0ABD0Z0D4_9HEMI